MRPNISAISAPDIIKVETVGQGDETRGWPPFPAPGLGTVFLSANRNKRSIAVDMKPKRARDRSCAGKNPPTSPSKVSGPASPNAWASTPPRFAP